MVSNTFTNTSDFSSLYQPYLNLFAVKREFYDCIMAEAFSFLARTGPGYCYECAFYLRDWLSQTFGYSCGELLTFSRKVSKDVFDSYLAEHKYYRSGLQIMRAKYGSFVSVSCIRANREPEGILWHLSDFIIPHDPAVYKGTVSWVYHTVFVYDGFVFTPELRHPVPLDLYKALVKYLNFGSVGTPIGIRPEKMFVSV